MCVCVCVREIDRKKEREIIKRERMGHARGPLN